jgi:hypothetical protein
VEADAAEPATDGHSLSLPVTYKLSFTRKDPFFPSPCYSFLLHGEIDTDSIDGARAPDRLPPRAVNRIVWLQIKIRQPLIDWKDAPDPSLDGLNGVQLDSIGSADIWKRLKSYAP